MKRFLVLLAFVVTGGGYAMAQGPPPSPAPAAAPRPGQGYEAFRLVRTRNVFDPERKAAPPASGAKPAATPAPTRADYVTLTGTMVTADKSLAFFSGSRPDFNKVLPVRERIAGATITKVTPSDIEVERDGKRVTVAVGLTVPLDNSSAPAAPPAAAGDDPANPAAPKSSTPDKDEVLRRLMERRQQELK